MGLLGLLDEAFCGRYAAYKIADAVRLRHNLPTLTLPLPSGGPHIEIVFPVDRMICTQTIDVRIAISNFEAPVNGSAYLIVNKYARTTVAARTFLSCHRLNISAALFR